MPKKPSIKQARRPTIVDVAKHAGVSVTAASQSMRDAGRISKDTRAKVKASARKLNYMPNKMAANLRSGEVKQVGLLVQDISNPFNAELASGVVHVLDAADHLIYLLDADEDGLRQHRLIESIVQSGVCGLIWHPAIHTDSRTIDFILKAGLATTTALRSLPDEQFDYVGVNDLNVSREACSHLIKNGHRFIGFLGGERGVIESTTQFSGYTSALEAAGLPLNLDYFSPCHADKKSAHDSMLQLLEASSELTAVVCYNDVVAFGAHYALLSSGRKVGEGFALVGCDDIEDATLMTPSLSTVSVSPHAIGQMLAKTFLERLKNPSMAVQILELEPSLVMRGSSDFKLT